MENRLWLIWKEPKERRRFIIGELDFLNGQYRFKYIDPELNDARKKGLDFFPGFSDLKKEYISKELFANIESRLPNPSRPEYLSILNTYELDMNSTEMEILSRTKGRLLTDNFEFVPIFDKNKIEFEIAGTRHSSDIQNHKNSFKVNDTLYLEMDKNNEYDKYAIKVMCDKGDAIYHLGYVPRYYSKELSEILDKKINYSAKIKYLNFESQLNDEDITVDVKIIFNEK